MDNSLRIKNKTLEKKTRKTHVMRLYVYRKLFVKYVEHHDERKSRSMGITSGPSHSNEFPQQQTESKW